MLKVRVQDGITDYELFAKQLVALHAIVEGGANCTWGCQGSLSVRHYQDAAHEEVVCFACGYEYPLPTQAMREGQTDA